MPLVFLQPAPIPAVDPTSSMISTRNNDLNSSTAALTDSNGVFIHQQDRLSSEDIMLLQDPPYKLTLPINELLAPAKRTRKINKKLAQTGGLTEEDEKPPRPQNGWVIFRKDYEAKLRELNPEETYKIQDISKTAGPVWRDQSEKVKKYFEVLQRVALEKHKAMYPNYKYMPKKKDQSANTTSVTAPKNEKNWVFREMANRQPPYLYEHTSGEECRMQINPDTPTPSSLVNSPREYSSSGTFSPTPPNSPAEDPFDIYNASNNCHAPSFYFEDYHYATSANTSIPTSNQSTASVSCTPSPNYYSAIPSTNIFPPISNLLPSYLNNQNTTVPSSFDSSFNSGINEKFTDCSLSILANGLGINLNPMSSTSLFQGSTMTTLSGDSNTQCFDATSPSNSFKLEEIPLDRYDFSSVSQQFNEVNFTATTTTTNNNNNNNNNNINSNNGNTTIFDNGNNHQENFTPNMVNVDGMALNYQSGKNYNETLETFGGDISMLFNQQSSGNFNFSNSEPYKGNKFTDNFSSIKLSDDFVFQEDFTDGDCIGVDGMNSNDLFCHLQQQPLDLNLHQESPKIESGRIASTFSPENVTIPSPTKLEFPFATIVTVTTTTTNASFTVKDKHKEISSCIPDSCSTTPFVPPHLPEFLMNNYDTTFAAGNFSGVSFEELFGENCDLPSPPFSF
ncbi:hypothetical protein G9A89_003124 [Geosiphon pyriformis]|nr:hypothetical protein G9A89_003124 [Geosiphon pyriformis]